ncbi:hypothetical protein ACP4OV_017489 [Aristida adscensionis]
MRNFVSWPRRDGTNKQSNRLVHGPWPAATRPKPQQASAAPLHLSPSSLRLACSPAMAAWPNPALPLLLVAALLAFEDWLTTPSCSGGSPAAGDLRAMMVADLMLLGSDAPYADRFFRDHVMSKFFANSIQTLKPDMLVVLGDISAKGLELTEGKWISVIEQFERILGRYTMLPLHIALGDKDIGTCATLDRKFVHRRAKHLPALDSSGCGAFEISNVSFVSLNAVALLCGTNALRFDVEKVMERESHHFQTERVNEAECFHLGCEKRETVADLNWRQNSMESGSGPVILLHFPLHKFDGEVMGVPTFSQGIVSDDSSILSSSKQSGANARRLYDQSLTLPANSTQYILQALKPRIIFNAHAGSFSEFVHADGTREVTVPAMTWKTGGVPGFVIATFDAKGDVTLRFCSLAQEWLVIMGYLAFLFLTALAVRWSN